MKTLQIWHSSSLILPLRHIIWFSCELDCIRFHRGFISDDMLCTCVDRTEKLLLCVRPAGVRPCPDWLLPSPGERKLFSFPFSFPFLHSLSLNCTCLMSWHLFFQSFSPHTHTLHHFPSMPALAFSCVSFSSSSNVLPAGIHNAPEGTEEKYHPLLSRNSFYRSTSHSRC